MEGLNHHQRCSSESFFLDQPSWLDDLLNEPDTLVYKGHRRSASDSSEYLGFVAKALNTKEEDNLKIPNNLVRHVDPWHASFDKWPSSSNKEANKVSEPSPKESEGFSSTAITKPDQEDFGSQNQTGLTERSNGPQNKPSVSKAEAKRAKQQSAHRSWVRRLQYRAQLERSLQYLQAAISEVSVDLEFLEQLNLILGVENRALRHRLESLYREDLIKQFDQEKLEREIARLQKLYRLELEQQQEHAKHPHSGNEEDLDAQFGNLSIEH